MPFFAFPCRHSIFWLLDVCALRRYQPTHDQIWTRNRKTVIPQTSSVYSTGRGLETNDIFQAILPSLYDLLNIIKNSFRSDSAGIRFLVGLSDFFRSDL